MATVTISQEELFKLLKMMMPFMKIYNKKKAMTIMLEVSIDNGVMFMSIPNCTMNAKCETVGTSKFSMQFLYFYDIIKTTKDEVIILSTSENKITIGLSGFKAITQ